MIDLLLFVGLVLIGLCVGFVTSPYSILVSLLVGAVAGVGLVHICNAVEEWYRWRR